MKPQAPLKKEIAELVEFIHYSLKQGLSVEQIQESLLESGQPEDCVAVALQNALGPAVGERSHSRSLPDLELVTASVLSSRLPGGEGIPPEPKIELMDFPRSETQRGNSRKKPRGALSDRDLILAYKAALNKKSKRKKEKRSSNHLLFWIAVGIAGFVFLRALKY